MSYRTLKSVFHQNDATVADAEEAARRASLSAVHWEFNLGEYPMFCLVTTDIAVLIERIMAAESLAQFEWSELSAGVRAQYLYSMIIEEIQATNTIEDVRSTRREIAAALDAMKQHEAQGQTRRFKEMARLYAGLSEGDIDPPSDLDGIRALYDAVTAGEIADGDAPDGERFRVGPVSVTSGQRVVHSGVMPESAINKGLVAMLGQARDDSIPRLIRAVVGHLMFENVHPFYDGNGRTGRYLLALDLSAVLSPLAWLSLSATIADNKDKYYRAFAEVENALNRGDATPFVEAMLEIVLEAQQRLAADLSDRRARVGRLGERIEQLRASSESDGDGLNHLVSDGSILMILFILGQVALFGPGGIASLDTIASSLGKSKQFARSRLGRLVEAGLVDQVSKRPLRFTLSRSGRTVLALGDAAPSDRTDR